MIATEAPSFPFWYLATLSIAGQAGFQFANLGVKPVHVDSRRAILLTTLVEDTGAPSSNCSFHCLIVTVR